MNGRLGVGVSDDPRGVPGHHSVVAPATAFANCSANDTARSDLVSPGPLLPISTPSAARHQNPNHHAGYHYPCIVWS